MNDILVDVGYIELTRDQFAVVDLEDFDEVSKYNWHANKSGNKTRDVYYAYRAEKGKHVAMHREIMGLEYGDNRQVDHINGDGIDNRRCNLKIVSNRENGQNRHVEDTSKYPGVYWDKHNQKWRAHIQINGKIINIGSYSDEETAHDDYVYLCQVVDDPELFKIGLMQVRERNSRERLLKAKGYYYHKGNGKYMARFTLKGKTRYIGYYKTAEEAREAYIKALENYNLI